MHKNSYEIRIHSWAGVVAEANGSGLTKIEWCRQHDIPIRKFHYWQSKVRQYLLEHPGLSACDLAKKNSHLTPVASSQSFYEIEIPSETTLSDNSWQLQPSSFISAHPALMLKFASFQLYIGDGFSESTLASVLKVMKNA